MYFEHGSIDVLPCLGTWAKRKDWWSTHYKQCKNSVGRRIVIATPRVRELIQSTIILSWLTLL